MEPIKHTVESILKGLRDKKRGAGDAGPEDWLKNILTKKELQHIKFNYLRKGVLGLKVDSSSWLYKLALDKERLLEKLAGFSGEIKDIRFRIGEMK